MPAPRVSVICIFHQAERFLAEAVDSVLAQDFRDFELLLVDDGSTDGGTAIAQGYAARLPGTVRWLDHPGHANRGMSATRNRGLAEARGQLLAFIDADDVWRPGKLRAQVALLDAHPEAGMVCGALEYWRSWQGGTDSVVRIGRHQGRLCHPPRTVLDLYPLGTFPAVSVDALVRRAVVDRVGGFEDRFTGLYEDQAFFAKVLATTPVWFAPDAWLRYRQHDASCVAQTRAAGLYRQRRGAFLDWLAEWIAAHDVPGRPRLQRALRRERWKLRHPLAARVLTRLQRALPDLLA